MRILCTADLGSAVRERRKSFGYTQKELADYCRCGTRFISDLENGKESIQLGKALEVVAMLGLNAYIEGREVAR